MFIGFRRDRVRADRASIEDRLRQLLQSRSLRPYRFSARCEIGPFVVAHVCRERSLVVELLVPGQQAREAQRAAFLAELGYVVVHVSARDLQLHPGGVKRRIRSALRLAPPEAGGNRPGRSGI
jgi:very-short-patch-repair endonuclease